MRILYVSQYFPPEMGAPSARVHELSREWVREGHDVTVLTGFAHHPIGVKAPGDRGRITRRESVDGIDVVRSYVFAAPNQGTGKRMFSYSTFMVSSAIVGSLRISRPDVVIATSPQLLCACSGHVLARVLGAPFVFEVRDVWPESILAVGAMRENLIVRTLRKVARHLYETSDRIVTVGDGYKRGIQAMYPIPDSQFEIVPNGIDPDLFVPGPRDNEIRREYGWGERLVALYIGTHGMAHALHVVLDAARRFKDDPRKLFVFVGEGAEKERLKRLAADWKLENVQFIDQQVKARVPLFYAACDVGLVSLRDTQNFREVLPSKIFEYLAMERPVIISVDGDARRLVESAGGGVFVPPENADALAAAVERAAEDRGRLRRMGRSGRKYVLAHYTRRKLAGDYLDVLEQVRRKARGES